MEDNRNGEIHIPSSCFQINKNKIFTINIHEYLKFLQQFELCIFLAENIKIAPARQIFILTFGEKFHFLSEMWSWFRLNFCSVTRKLIISYVLILISVPPRYQHSKICFYTISSFGNGGAESIVIFSIPTTSQPQKLEVGFPKQKLET